MKTLFLYLYRLFRSIHICTHTVLSNYILFYCHQSCQAKKFRWFCSTVCAAHDRRTGRLRLHSAWSGQTCKMREWNMLAIFSCCRLYFCAGAGNQYAFVNCLPCLALHCLCMYTGHSNVCIYRQYGSCLNMYMFTYMYIYIYIYMNAW